MLVIRRMKIINCITFSIITNVEKQFFRVKILHGNIQNFMSRLNIVERLENTELIYLYNF